QLRRMDVGIAVDLPVAQKARVLQPRDHAENPRLLGKAEMVLETDNIVGVGAQVFLPQLHYCIRTLPSARVDQPHRLHRPEAQRIPPPPGDLLNRQAAFEIVQVFPIVSLDRLRRDQGVVEAVVLFFGQGTVDVISRSLTVARGTVHPRHVDGFGFDDWADGIVEKRCDDPLSLAISWDSASEVSGPVAMMVSPWVSSTVRTSSRRTRISGSRSIASVTLRAKAPRSTASAWPAGTAVS